MEGTTTTMVTNGDVFSSLSVTAALRSYSAKYADAILRRTMFKEWFLFQNKLESSLFFLERHPVVMNVCCIRAKSDYFFQTFQTSDKQQHWNSRSIADIFIKYFFYYTDATAVNYSIVKACWQWSTFERFWERNLDKQVDCDSSKESVAMFVDVKRL